MRRAALHLPCQHRPAAASGNGGLQASMETTIMENQMEKKMENEMETGIIMGYIGVYIGIMENRMETTIVYWNHVCTRSRNTL